MRLRTSTTGQSNRRQRKNADWRSPNRDRAMFFAFFIAGVIVILALKTLVDSQFVVTAIPCILMLGYAWLLWDFGESRARYDGAGDNLYYLGFLYTLTSLAYSLYAFSADEEDTEVIVTNFGIAIATTILGMALRILLARPVVDDPAALEEATRLELATTARKLRAEMTYIVATFRESLEGDLRNLCRGVETFTQQLEQDLAHFRERLSQQAEEIRRINVKTTERLQSVEQSMERVEDGTNKAALALVERVRELGESTQTINSFTESVHRLDTRIAETVKTVDENSKAIASGLNQISKSLEGQATEIGDIDFRRAFDRAIEPASNELRAAAIEFRKLLEAMRQADVLRERALLRGEKATVALQQTLARLQELSDVLADALDRSKSHDFAGSLSTIAEQLSQFCDSAGAAANQLSTVRDELSWSVGQIRETNVQMKEFSSILETAAKERNRGPSSNQEESGRDPEGQGIRGWLDRFRPRWWSRKD